MSFAHRLQQTWSETSFNSKPHPPLSAGSAKAIESNDIRHTNAAQDVEFIGRQKAKVALEQVEALIAAAEEEGVGPQQLETLRQSMEELRLAL